MCAGGLLHVDVGELRERTQQLADREIGLRRVWSRGRDAEERVRHRPGRVGDERLVLRIELVDVDQRVAGSAPAQIAAGQTGVADGDGDAAGQLALQVERVLLDARRALVRIDEVDVAADAGQQPEALPLGCTSPFGNGLLIETVGTLLVACGTSVVAE